MSNQLEGLDGVTRVDGRDDYQHLLTAEGTAGASSAQQPYRDGAETLKSRTELKVSPVAAESLPFVDSSAYLSVKRPLLVPIGRGGVKAALIELDQELRKGGLSGIISKKRPHQIIGREVNPGSFGLYEYASSPQVLLEPGKYPGLPFSNWIGCVWKGQYDLAQQFPPVKEDRNQRGLLTPDTELSKLGLTIVQVSQNQAAVCMDPQSQVFVVADGGFVAMATSGAYRVLGLVDQTHLSTPVIDPYTKQVLGSEQTVKLPGGYVAAQFLSIPANNVCILQRRDEMFALGAGQHYLVTTAVTVRGFYTMGEVQVEITAE